MEKDERPLLSSSASQWVNPVEVTEDVQRVLRLSKWGKNNPSMKKIWTKIRGHENEGRPIEEVLEDFSGLNEPHTRLERARQKLNAALVENGSEYELVYTERLCFRKRQK